MPRAAGHLVSRGPLSAAAVTIALASLGCSGEPRIPTVSGVVAAVEGGPGSASRVVLEGGQDVLIEGTRNQLYGGGSPDVGDLVVTGPNGGETWYIVVSPGPPGGAAKPCFPLVITGVDRGARSTRASEFASGRQRTSTAARTPTANTTSSRTTSALMSAVSSIGGCEIRRTSPVWPVPHGPSRAAPMSRSSSSW